MKSAALLGLAVFALAACNDPAKDKTKAQTGEAQQAASVSNDATKLDIDPATSKIEWTGSKVSASHDGGFKSFHGTVALAGNDPEKSSVNVEIDTDSLYTEPANLVTHLKSKDFFDVEHFPKATFVSTSVKKGGEKATHTVAGNLTLHGVTKSITFPATIKTGTGGVDVDAEFTINRRDFGMVYPGKADDLIRDGVVIKLAIRSHPKS
ncbi:MAG: YceI family protein [Labilithrix sp.]